MRGSRLQKLFWIGPISENVSLKVISVVANFHAFIINLNEFFFWSMPAGLYKCYEQLPQESPMDESASSCLFNDVVRE